ncbi:MAG: hypothetical protein D6698_09620 [Gammaproteobacteria bacterium]|nr:MAG: hypothetical protein D6698_09620 [Gammaproteobacteria bacterium]
MTNLSSRKTREVKLRQRRLIDEKVKVSQIRPFGKLKIEGFRICTAAGDSVLERSGESVKQHRTR